MNNFEFYPPEPPKLVKIKIDGKEHEISATVATMFLDMLLDQKRSKG